MTLDETLPLLALMIAPALFSLLGMAALGSPVVALLGEIAAKTKSKVFYDKYGQQTASMGWLLLILTLLVEGAGVSVIYAKYPQLVDRFMAQIAMFTPLLAAAAIFLLFGLPYLLLWKKMRNAKPIHMVMGACASMAAIATIALVIPAKLAFTMDQTPINPDIVSLLLPLSILYAVMIIAAAAGLSCPWLVLRRNKDDFGRDYYNFAIRQAARWALIPMVGAIACQGWLFYSLPPTIKTLVIGTPLGLVWSAGTSLGVLVAIIWLLISRNPTPLRMKGLIFLSTILLWLAHTANVFVFVNFMSM